EGEARGGWITIGFVEGHGNSNSPKEYSFIDDNVTSGKYAYRLKQIDNDGTFEHSKIIEIDVDAPLEFELSQNYPNPFNPSTEISFSIKNNSQVKLSVYNSGGEIVSKMINGMMKKGSHSVNFDASELTGGIYFYKLEVDGRSLEKKMLLLK
ncbi:MAG: T9SS type A sorting domain-containing protein, partial [Candidatus Delongbacteria bacterium]|nr:T9SS type A sorting domain-containing protein [Candidatus Delongbacteria bacterium]